jgi:hypothetical protein
VGEELGELELLVGMELGELELWVGVELNKLNVWPKRAGAGARQLHLVSILNGRCDLVFLHL